MADDVRFSIIATDSASGPLGDVSSAAERLGETFRGPSSRGAETFAGALDEVETSSQRTERANERLGDSVEDLGSARLSRASSASASWAKSLTAITVAADFVLNAVSSVAGSIATFIQSTTENAAQLDRFALVLGISTRELSALQFAASTVGVELDDVRDALGTASENMSEFVTLGTGPAEEALRRFNLTLTDSSGNLRPIGALLPELADSFVSVGNRADRLRLAIQLFGEEAAYRLLPILENGRTGLEAYGAEASRVGAIVSDELIQSSATWQQGLAQVQGALQGVGNTILEAVLPTLNAALPAIVDFLASFRESAVLHDVAIPALQAIAQALTFVASGLSTVTPVLTFFARLVIQEFTDVATFLGIVVQGWRDLFTGIRTVVESSGLGEFFSEATTLLAPFTAAVIDVVTQLTSIARVWELINAAVNAGIAGILDALASVTEGLGTLIRAATTAAEFLGFEKIASGLRGAREAIVSTTTTLDRLRDAARETSADWLNGTFQQRNAQETVTTEVVATARALQTIPVATAAAVKAQVDGATTITQAVGEAATAWTRLDVTTRAQLERQAGMLLEAFAGRVRDATTHVEDLRAAWPKVAAAIERVTGRAAPAFEEALGIIEGRVGGGIERVNSAIQSITPVTDSVTTQVVRGFTIQRDEATRSWTLIQDGVQTTNDNIRAEWRNTGDDVAFVFTNIAARGSDLWTRLTQQSRTSTRSVLENFPPISEETRQVFAEIEAESIALNRLMVQGFSETEARVILNFRRMGNAGEDAFRNIASRIGDTGREFTPLLDRLATADREFFQFADTIQDLQFQVEFYNARLRNLNILHDQAGLNAGYFAAQSGILRDVLGELNRRIVQLHLDQVQARGSFEGLSEAERQTIINSLSLDQRIRIMQDGVLDLRTSTDAATNAFRVFGQEIAILTDAQEDVAETTERQIQQLTSLARGAREAAGAIMQVTAAQLELQHAQRNPPPSDGGRGGRTDFDNVDLADAVNEMIRRGDISIETRRGAP